MTRHRPITLALVALAAGAAGVAASALPGRPDEGPPIPAARAAPAPPPPVPTPSPPRAAAPLPPESMPPRPHAPPAGTSTDREASAVAAAFDAVVRREAPDPSWRSEVSARARDALDTLDPLGVWLGRVECGRTLCRLEVQLADEIAFEAFARSVSEIPTERGQAFVYLEEQDDLDIEVYVGRDGEPLPIPGT